MNLIPPKGIPIKEDESVEEEATEIVRIDTSQIEIDESNLPEIKKRKYGRIDKKDEKTILKGIREFRPLYLIARDLGVCRQTLYMYLRDKMDTCYRDMRESMLDVAESKLFKNVIDGNQNAIQFFLDRQGKNRGYGEKQILDRQDVPVIQIGKIEIKPSTDNKIIEVTE